MLTIFTPTYNRAHTLPRLYLSLQGQTCKDFEWLVIDDGSTDNTSSLFERWTQDNNEFSIRYSKVQNGGKLRALNKGIKQAKGDFFLVLDSDDLLCKNAVETILTAFYQLPNDPTFIGISMVRGDMTGRPIRRTPKIDPSIGYIDCNNLDRPKYDLQSDMAEVFFTEKLRKYEFPIWSDEKFTPEEVIWNQMALDGFKLRWFNKIEYLCEYQPDGLTNSTWKLLRDNPMGYAMMFNHRLLYSNGIKEKINNSLQFICCCCLKKEYGYLRKCNSIWLPILLFPIGYLLSRRRRKQILANT